MVQVRRRTVVLAAGGSALSAGAGALLMRSRSPLAAAAGRPVRTSFGWVALLGSSRTDTSGTGPETGTGHAAHGSQTSASAAGSIEVPTASAVHGAWTSSVVVEVRARNRSRAPVQLSPGQFRVRVEGGGPTVSLYSCDLDALPLEPGASRTMRITYLAPPPGERLSLEFADAGARRPARLGAVGRRTAHEGGHRS